MQELAWGDLSPVEQLQWLAYREDDSHPPPRPTGLRSALGALPRPNTTIRTNASFPPNTLSSEEFFLRHFREVMHHMPLALWAPVLGACAPRQLPITSVTRSHMTELSSRWRHVAEADHATVTDAFKLFIGFLVKALSWKRSTTWEHENECLPCVSLSVPGVTMPPASPAICTALGITGNDPTGQHERVLYIQQELTRRRRSRLVLDFVLGPEAAVAAYQRIAFENDDLIFVDEQRLKGIFLAERYGAAVNAVLYESLGFSRLNPYTTEKPVASPEMFFGREAALNTIRDHPWQDFMIVGPRRIGKSSVCRYLERTCAGVGDRIPIYADAGMVSSPQELIATLTLGVNPRRVRNTQLSNFATMLKTNYTQRRLRYLFLIDEIDPLLVQAANAANWQLFEVLRFLSQKQLAQTVFTGYRALYEAWMDLKSPLYNYARPIYLGSLDANSARNLAVKPMQAIGASYNKNEQQRIVRHILDVSGRHPYVIQFLCGSLLEILSKKEGRPSVIAWKDIVRLHKLPDFREFVLKPFNRENLTQLERLMLLIMVKTRRDEFDLDWLVGALHDHGVRVSGEAIVTALLNLEIPGLLRSSVTGDPEAWSAAQPGDLRYHIAIPAFTEAMRQKYPIEHEIEAIVKELPKI